MAEYISPIRTRRTLTVDERRIDAWPQVDQSKICSSSDRELFERRRQAIAGYIKCEGLVSLTQNWGICAKEIRRMTARCLVLCPLDGRIWGFRALVPNIRIEPYIRLAERDKSSVSRAGYSGMMSRLFRRFPAIWEKVSQAYLNVRKSRTEAKMPRVPMRSVFRTFIRECRSAGIEPTEYPFAVKNLGRRSLADHLDRLWKTHLTELVRGRNGANAARLLSTGTGVKSTNVVLLPYQRVIYDAHRADAYVTVLIPHRDGGFILVTIERPWFLVIMDIITRAILAWTICIDPEVSAADVLRCVRQAVTPSDRPELTIPGLVYNQKGGLPGWVFPSLKWAVWSELMYDNAKPNISEWVRNKITSVLCSAVNPGPVRQPEHRALIERLFETLEEHSGHVLPSTTGSSPSDSRRTDPEGNARRYEIRLSQLEEVMAVVVADYNGTPHEGLGFRTPIEQLAYFVEEQVIIRHVEESDRPNLGLLNIEFLCTVRGNIKKGRRPYIQVLRERYSNELLAQMPELIGTKIRVIADEDDMRSVRSFLVGGRDLGTLRALGKWREVKHSLRTRLATNRRYARKILHEADSVEPVEALLDHLSRAGAKTSRRAAGEYERVRREAGHSENHRPRPELNEAASEDLFEPTVQPTKRPKCVVY